MKIIKKNPAKCELDSRTESPVQMCRYIIWYKKKNTFRYFSFIFTKFQDSKITGHPVCFDSIASVNDLQHKRR